MPVVGLDTLRASQQLDLTPDAILAVAHGPLLRLGDGGPAATVAAADPFGAGCLSQRPRSD